MFEGVHAEKGMLAWCGGRERRRGKEKALG
jgi:hypothetical protein